MSTRKIFCHPANAEKLRRAIKEANEVKDIFMPYGYDIVSDPYIPEYTEKKTGKLIWKKNKFINYEEPADLDMSWQDYVDMALYFGWCKEEVIREIVFYEIDTGKSNFMDVFDAFATGSAFGRGPVFNPPALTKGIVS